ncbi:MAG: hypothetical protein IPJ74_24250 [Saprospiraceae bacterium]|nr:hypothetical protein [Saprospiraceae bacterium]
MQSFDWHFGEVVEILALAGFDWLFLDMEHGNLSIASVQRLCQAIAGRCHTLVRVPENAPIWIKKFWTLAATASSCLMSIQQRKLCK